MVWYGTLCMMPVWCDWGMGVGWGKVDGWMHACGVTWCDSYGDLGEWVHEDYM